MKKPHEQLKAKTLRNLKKRLAISIELTKNFMHPERLTIKRTEDLIQQLESLVKYPRPMQDALTIFGLTTPWWEEDDSEDYEET